MSELQSLPGATQTQANWEPKKDNINLAPSKIIGRSQNGLDIHYDLLVARGEDQFSLTVPWVSQTVCPNCFGWGQILTLAEPVSVYRSTNCPRCGGKGHLETHLPITVIVTPKMAEMRQFRLQGAGLSDPQSLSPGDLVLSLNYVDSFPQSH
ncbi:MAG: hypothetical protein LBT38_02540 [Deltaproteobacteria bacterium]|jgi:hypothetical protein|nr:hypothetical protein [Deltaproteobacteria bacterium]